MLRPYVRRGILKIGLFTEFSSPGKSEEQTYSEVLEQIALADELGYDFFSTTESYGKDLFSCSPFPLGLYVAAAQRARRIRFLKDTSFSNVSTSGVSERV